MVWAMAGMTLLRADIANPAVALIDVLPTHDFGYSGRCLGRLAVSARVTLLTHPPQVIPVMLNSSSCKAVPGCWRECEVKP